MALDWSDDAHRARMEKGWRGGLVDGTSCGSGSTLEHSKSVADRLPDLISRYGVRLLCDAGAGDLHWISRIELGCKYRGFDLHPWHRDVEPCDITTRPLPLCDLILCRHVLIHFDPARIVKTIELFRMSSTHLLASQYDDCYAFDTTTRSVKGFDPRHDYNPTDLRGLLGEPLERLPDWGSDLALWKL